MNATLPEPARVPRLLILVVAYQAEGTITGVLRRLPGFAGLDVEVLVIDDCSADGTFKVAERLRDEGGCPHRLTVLVNPVNQGYGGNQKLGYRYALEQGHDFVALLHGDGQYAPESLPDVLAPLRRGEADLVLGSRMLSPGGARRGGMPLYKRVGNQLLTACQNRILGVGLSEYHTGCKAFRADLLRRIPFELNADVFHFDPEFIVQALRTGARITEVPFPTRYGDEICRVNGLRYASDTLRTTLVARLQDWGLLYRRNFDVVPPADAPAAPGRLSFPSVLTAALEAVPAGTVVLDLGGAGAELCGPLRARGCRVLGWAVPPERAGAYDEVRGPEAGSEVPPDDLRGIDVVLLLDELSRQADPETYASALRAAAGPGLKVVLSTGNLGFVVPRLMLLAGHFNPTRRGILDVRHRRLFTLHSLRRLLREGGFRVERITGVPAPIPLALANPAWSRRLLAVQRYLIRLAPGWFAYQLLAEVRPLPNLPALLEATRRHSAARAARENQAT
ncbi:MAG: glycosyltransferase [Verrucomicrobia bacterium]|nr:glycosyltransferase [Verrucomicrobiota bacterium]